MPQVQHTYEDPYVLGPVLDARLEVLKEWIGQRFDDVQSDIARIERSIDGVDVHTREHCRMVEVQLHRHENRLVVQEAQSLWRWGAIALSALLAVLGIRLPR